MCVLCAFRDSVGYSLCVCVYVCVCNYIGGHVKQPLHAYGAPLLGITRVCPPVGDFPSLYPLPGQLLTSHMTSSHSKLRVSMKLSALWISHMNYT